MNRIADRIVTPGVLINYRANQFRDEYLKLPAHAPRHLQVLDQPSCLCWYISGPESWVVIADKRRSQPATSPSDKLYRLTIHEEKVSGRNSVMKPLFYVKSWSEVILVGTDMAKQLQRVPTDGLGYHSYPHGSIGLMAEIIAWAYMDSRQRWAADIKWQHWDLLDYRDWLDDEYLLSRDGYMERAKHGKILDVASLEAQLADRRERYADR